MSKLADRLARAVEGRYEVVEELGRGGMSMVFRAVDRRHDRQVAVKVLLPELAASVGARRFLQEIGIAAGLVHPHILPLYDSGEAEGLLYHVTPCVEGETLRERLRRERLLPVDDAVRITIEIADALDFAHTRGVIHRDIKPGNILLARRHALITDFGVARAISLGGGERLTESGMAVGTPAYMSPEQARADDDLDGRSDIYSLACVAYEMLTGEAPLSGRTPQATMVRRQAETPASLRVLRETVPPELDAAVLAGLARLAVDRPPDAGAFAKSVRVGSTTTGGYTAVGSSSRPAIGAATGRSPAARRSLTLWEELKRRKVYNVGAIYLATAVGIVGVTDAVADGSPWERWIYVALAGGFFVALLLSWLFEISREGVRRTGTYDGRFESGPRRGILSRRSAVVVLIILLLAYAAWALLGGAGSPQPR